MCTVTWLWESERFTLLFNRDEQRTRLPAEPPRIWDVDGHTILAPRDGQAGGTWLAANRQGLVVCLLNYYEREPGSASRQGEAPESRGLLVLEAATGSNLAALTESLAERSLSRMRPFHLLAFDTRASRGRYWLWDGDEVQVAEIDDALCPVTTSSYASQAVVADRRALFHAWRDRAGGALSVDALERYHHSRHQEADAYSVFMSRPDAQTVSVTRVEVVRDEVRMVYQPRPPEAQDALSFSAVLALTPSEAQG